ncbi:MAG: hypothetical protein KDE50_30600, partial [Caldilineaceae bacterium]|nr:hypothetical protein [Caldilineaceae bacterium]
MKSSRVPKRIWLPLITLILLMSLAAFDCIPGLRGAVVYAQTNQTVIDFNNFPAPRLNFQGGSEDGFTLAVSGDPLLTSTASRGAGSLGLPFSGVIVGVRNPSGDNNEKNGSLIITKADNSAFRFVSVDAATSAGSTPARYLPLTVQGYLNGQLVGTDTFIAPRDATTFAAANLAGQDVDQLVFTLQGNRPRAVFVDNIVLEADLAPPTATPTNTPTNTPVPFNGLLFTLDAPGVQTSQVSCPSGLTLETFNSIAMGSYQVLHQGIGGYLATGSIIEIKDQDQFGGAEQPSLPTHYITTSAGYQLILAQPAGYFGFWWSAGDFGNSLTINMADGSSQTYDMQTILNSGTLQTSGGPTGHGHYGNPTTAFLGQDTDEPFAFINIFAGNAGAKITRLTFSHDVNGSTFETDNHTFCADLLSVSGTTIP